MSKAFVVAVETTHKVLLSDNRIIRVERYETSVLAYEGETYLGWLFQPAGESTWVWGYDHTVTGDDLFKTLLAGITTAPIPPLIQ